MSDKRKDTDFAERGSGRINADKQNKNRKNKDGKENGRRTARSGLNIKRTLINLCFPLASIALLLAIYAIAAAVVGESLILPKAGEVLMETLRQLSHGALYKSLATTLLRAAIAFICAFIAGSALGVAAHFYSAVQRLLSPVMVLLRALPTVAIIFLLVLWFRSAAAPSIVAFTILMPLSYTAMTNALGSLDDGLFEMSKVYEVKKSRILLRFVLPQTAPPLLDSAAGNLSFAVKLVVAGEALAQSAVGLGGMLNMANIYLETATLMAVTLIAVVVCFILEGGVKALRKLICGRWL